MGRGQPLAQRQRDGGVGIFHDARQFGKELVTDGDELVLALSGLAHEFIAAPHQSLQLGSSLGRGNEAANELRFVGHLHPQLELAVELVCQGERVSFVRFEQTRWSTLHVHDIDRDVQFLQVLLERAMIVAGALEQHERVLQRAVGAHALDEQAEALAGVLEHEGGAGLEAVMTREQSLGEEACHVLALANVDANIDRLMEQQRNRGEVWRERRWRGKGAFGHGTVVLPSAQGRK